MIQSKINRDHNIQSAFNRLNEKINRIKTCVNVWDDDCANSDVPGTGEDYDNFGNGSPGKRSGAGTHPCAHGLKNVACRTFLQQKFGNRP
jgi:hypothetical protein